jgi:16S rRNA (cytidine1402-2'-O)-methyltransferase
MLYICPTPIGNLQDVTLRVLDVLKQVELIACEDTRRTRILLSHYGIRTRLVSFHDHNEEQRIESLLPLLREGREIALVSDAGMPGLSDPGFSLVGACAAEQIAVTVLPGPSAVSTALVLSGLPADSFAFLGFLARGKSKLVEQLALFDGMNIALVAFESPRRIAAALAAIAERWPERAVVVCRELTKIHEEAIRGTASQVLGLLSEPVRGEIVLVLGPTDQTADREARWFSPQSGTMEDRARVALAELTGLGVGTKRAAGIIARLTGLPARRAYDLALAVRREAGK